VRMLGGFDRRRRSPRTYGRSGCGTTAVRGLFEESSDYVRTWILLPTSPSPTTRAPDARPGFLFPSVLKELPVGVAGFDAVARSRPFNMTH